MRYALSGLVLLLAGALGLQAHAQQEIPLQHEYYIGEGNVDLHKGVYTYANEDVVIGAEDQGATLALSRYFGVHQQAGSEAPFGMNTGHSLQISLYREQYLKEGQAPPNWSYEFALASGRALLTVDYINIPGLQYGTPEQAARTLISSNGATGPFVYTAEDGMRIEFPAFDGANATNCANIGFPSKTCVHASAVVKPNGERLTFTYESLSTRRRLRTVISTRGYAIGIDYGSASTDAPVSKACVVNLSMQYMAAAGPCPAGARAATYTYIPSPSAHTGLQSYSDASGATTNYSYRNGTEYWTMTGIRDPGSSVDNLTITYDSNYKVASQIYADGSTWNYAYQGLGSWYDYPQNEWTQVTNPLGQMTRHEFYSGGTPKPSSVRDPLNRTQSFQYVTNRPHLTFREVSPAGDYVEYQYDARDNRTEITQVAKSGSGLGNRAATASFPASCTNRVTCNKPDFTTDARGSRTDYVYDTAHGGILTETLPAPVPNAVRPQRRFSYAQYYAWYKNAAGALVQAPTPIWLVSSISECRMQASCTGTADETVTSFTYGEPGTANNLLLTSRTVKAGDNSVSMTTSWTYDQWGKVLTEDGVIPGAADTTRTRYDAMNRVIGVIGPDPDGAGPLPHRAVRTTYDSVGRVMNVERGTVVSQSDAHWAAFVPVDSTEYQRDSVGRVTATVVKGGGATYSVVHSNYDGAWRPQCTAQRMDPAQWGSQTNACVPQTSGPHGADRIVKNIYDVAGQVTKIQRAVGTADQIDEVSYSYTTSGKRLTLTDAQNNTTTYEYDGFDRPFRIRYPVPSPGAQLSSSTDFEQLGYDENDNVIQARLRSQNSNTYGYDALNRQTVKHLPAPEAAVSATYDLQGRALTVTQAGSTTTLSYGALGRLQSEETAYGTLSYLYDSAGRRTRMTWPDGFYVTYDYLTSGELSAIREYGAASGPGVLVSYGYDNLGRRSTVTRGNGTVTNFGYDAVSRLSSLIHNLTGSAFDVASSFTYNPASQIRTWSRDNDAYSWTSYYNTSRTYVANGLNQLTQSNSTSGSVAFGYDDRGNLTSYGPNVYGYTTENRLITASNGATLSYDPLGRLSQSSSISGTSRFQYDGAALVVEWNSSGQIAHRYVHGPSSDEPLVWYEGSGTANRRWLHQDERGSIVAVSNSAGERVAINSYDEYGIPAGSNVGRFQYTGQTWLPELGMYYYKARMYSPALGRFMQTDPIGYQDGFNLYAYVGNDPLNSTDPSGLLKTCSMPPPEQIALPDEESGIRVVVTLFPPALGADCFEDGQELTTMEEVVVTARKDKKFDNMPINFTSTEEIFFRVDDTSIQGFPPDHRYDCPNGTTSFSADASSFQGKLPGHVHTDFKPSPGPDDGRAAKRFGTAYMISAAGAYRFEKGTHGYSATLLDGSWGMSVKGIAALVDKWNAYDGNSTPGGAKSSGKCKQAY